MVFETREIASDVRYRLLFPLLSCASIVELEEPRLMARKTVLVCDNCGKEVEEGKGAAVRAIFTDARRGAKQADFCDDCAGKLPGKQVARRGRRPRAAAA